MVSRRQQWRNAVRAAAFNVGMRPVKATLLSLPIDPDGKLTAWREEIAEATGLPLRTVDRHLARACDAKWLAHEVHGGHGRRSTYAVRIPDEVARHKWQATDEVARHVVRATSLSCAPRGGELNKDSANVSEHVALDNHRQRRSEHGGTRTEDDRDELQLRAEEEVPAHSATAATLLSWNRRLSHAPLGRVPTVTRLTA